jgi:hypothetical protein
LAEHRERAPRKVEFTEIILLKSIVVCGAAARLSIHKFEHGI